jgi:hypothetical protein
MRSEIKNKSLIISDLKRMANFIFLKKLKTVIFALLAFSLTTSAQKTGLRSINKNDLKAYMSFFASDEMKGRELGTETNQTAALYLKTNLMRLGIKPLPITGDYFQKIPLQSKEIVKKETGFKIKNNNGDTIFSTDSLIYLMPLSESMEVTGNIVFAGYGYEDTISGYNDLKDVDLNGKIVVIMTRSPQMVLKGEGNMIFDSGTEEPKLGSVFSRAPAAIFYVYDPKSKFPDAYASGLMDLAAGQPGDKSFTLKNQEDNSVPVQIAFITQHTANMILKTTGYSLRQMQDKISTGGKPVSTIIPEITATLKTGIETTDFAGTNVVGIIEGSDPELKNECVIYTAHFDHEGVNNLVEVFNGADDNASGSMALLEVARAFTELKKKPLRSIIFAWVNGEEKGLLGSEYYAGNPVIPMEKTLLDINLDMVGRSKLPADTGKFMGFDMTVTQPGEILVYTAHESTELLNIMSSAAKNTGVRVTDMGKDLEFGTSDHASFIAKGVPALFFNSGIHSDLHQIGDDNDKIDFDKMEKVSKMVFLLGYKVANQRHRFKLDKQN